MQYLMALDAGTGSIRAVIFDVEGKEIAVAQKEWSHLEEEGVADSMGFDTEKNWLLVVACIEESMAKAHIKAEDILALSATSMREGIVLYDAQGKALWAVANVDARAKDEVRFLKEEYEGIEEAFYQNSGQTFALGALPRLLWLKNHRPKLYEKVAHISMIGDWILFRLSGCMASDPSNAGTTGIFSLENRSWQNTMAQKLGLKDDIFPPILESSSVMGTVTALASQETGLSEQTKVVMGGGDVQLGALGLGVYKEGQVAILGGSFWQQVVNIKKTQKPPLDMGIRINPHVISSLSQAEGISFFSGLVMRWFRDAFCELEKRQAQAEGTDAYAILEAQAQNVPLGSYGILPIFSDSMKYGKWYHASPSFINLSLDASQCNKASMFRSLEENACIVSAINLKKIEAFSKIKIKELVFAGGASKGALCCQILADVTGCTVHVPKVKEATALGASMSAGVGAGVYESLESASEALVKWDRTYLANQENHKAYEAIKAQWIEVYDAQLALVDKGLTQSMWKAPGL